MARGSAREASTTKTSTRGRTVKTRARPSLRKENDAVMTAARDPAALKRSFGPKDVANQTNGSYAERYQAVRRVGLLIQLKKRREVERAQAIKNGFLADPDRPRTLAEAITPTGTCQDMCAEFERLERITQNDVWGAESRPRAQGRPEPDEARMVKKFRRAAAGIDEQLPSDLRPPPVLRKTLDYLFNELITDLETLASVHHFVWDRTRAVRNDFSIQQVSKVADLEIAIECYERIARFHIVSLHQFARAEKPYDKYDAQQEREQLDKTLLSLVQYYDDSRGRLQSPNEPEFRAYCIIFQIQDPMPDLEDRVQTWPPHILSHAKVQNALAIYAAACNTDDPQGPLKPRTPHLTARADWGRFWRLIASHQISYTMACVAEIYFPLVRRTVLKSIWLSCRQAKRIIADWTVEELTRVMAFDSGDATERFCRGFEFDFVQEDGRRFINLNSVTKAFPQPDVGVMRQDSTLLVERKRYGRTMSAVISGMSVKTARREGLVVQEAKDDEMEEDSLFVPQTSQLDPSATTFIPEAKDSSLGWNPAPASTPQSTAVPSKTEADLTPKPPDQHKPAQTAFNPFAPRPNSAPYSPPTFQTPSTQAASPSLFLPSTTPLAPSTMPAAASTPSTTLPAGELSPSNPSISKTSFPAPAFSFTKPILPNVESNTPPATNSSVSPLSSSSNERPATSQIFSPPVSIKPSTSLSTEIAPKAASKPLPTFTPTPSTAPSVANDQALKRRNAIAVDQLSRSLLLNDYGLLEQFVEFFLPKIVKQEQDKIYWPKRWLQQVWRTERLAKQGRARRQRLAKSRDERCRAVEEKTVANTVEAFRESVAAEAPPQDAFGNSVASIPPVDTPSRFKHVRAESAPQSNGWAVQHYGPADTTRSTYFKLKAMGISPPNRKRPRVDDAQVSVKRPLLDRVEIAPARPKLNDLKRPLDQEDQDLLESMRQVKKAMSESITFFREEVAKNVQAEKLASSRDTSTRPSPARGNRVSKFWPRESVDATTVYTAPHSPASVHDSHPTVHVPIKVRQPHTNRFQLLQESDTESINGFSEDELSENYESEESQPPLVNGKSGASLEDAIEL